MSSTGPRRRTSVADLKLTHFDLHPLFRVDGALFEEFFGIRSPEECLSSRTVAYDHLGHVSSEIVSDLGFEFRVAVLEGFPYETRCVSDGRTSRDQLLANDAFEYWKHASDHLCLLPPHPKLGLRAFLSRLSSSTPKSESLLNVTLTEFEYFVFEILMTCLDEARTTVPAVPSERRLLYLRRVVGILRRRVQVREEEVSGMIDESAGDEPVDTTRISRLCGFEVRRVGVGGAEGLHVLLPSLRILLMECEVKIARIRAGMFVLKEVASHGDPVSEDDRLFELLSESNRRVCSGMQECLRDYCAARLREIDQSRKELQIEGYVPIRERKRSEVIAQNMMVACRDFFVALPASVSSRAGVARNLFRCQTLPSWPVERRHRRLSFFVEILSKQFHFVQQLRAVFPEGLVESGCPSAMIRTVSLSIGPELLRCLQSRACLTLDVEHETFAWPPDSLLGHPLVEKLMTWVGEGCSESERLYNEGCIYAILGNEGECRNRVEASFEASLLSSDAQRKTIVDAICEDDDLRPYWGREWYRDLSFRMNS